MHTQKNDARVDWAEAENFHLSLPTSLKGVSTAVLFCLEKRDKWSGSVLNQESRMRLEMKRELIRRLDHIQHLAKQKNYAEIERLLQERYV